MKLHLEQWSAQKTSRGRILFLHGMGGTGALWRPIAAGLEDDFDSVAPDQRGHGKSRPIPSGEDTDFSPLAYGRDVVATLEDATQPHYPTWIIGHSMGVRTACALAHLKPEWTQGLVLVDLGFTGMAGGGLGENLAAFLALLPHEFESRSEARAFMEQNCPDRSIAQYLMAVAVSKTGTSAITFPFDKQVLIQTIEAARDFSIRPWVEELAERGTPIHVLRGALSQVWSAEEFRAEASNFRQWPHVQFEEFAGAGHGLPFEKRREFVAKIRERMAAAP